MSVVQTLAVGAGLVVLYRFLLHTVGPERIGIWSVVLAATSMSGVANLGLSASAVKFVAKYHALDQEDKVSEVIQTTFVTLGLFFGVALLAIYPFSGWILGHIMPASRLAETMSIMPYALFSMWVMAAGSVFQAGLDGYQRMDVKSGLVIIGTAIFLTLSFVLVPSHGLMGLAYARIAQDSFMLAGSWAALRRHIRTLPVIRYRWDYKVFREMFVYGMNFQVISISIVLCDPLTKGLITRFGGLGMTGIYEMASRMVVQLRALLVAANQALVPAIASLHEKDPEAVKRVYDSSYRLLIYIAIPYFTLITAFIPIISRAWLGYYNGVFVLFSFMLVAGWFLNTLAAPAYYANLGIGGLGWNTAAHATIAVLNLSTGLLFGRLFGGEAVAAAWVFSLVAGSVIVVVSYHIQNGVPLLDTFPREHMAIGAAGLAAVLISVLLYRLAEHRAGLLPASVLVMLAVFLIMALPAWKNPMRKRLSGWISAGLDNRGVS